MFGRQSPINTVASRLSEQSSGKQQLLLTRRVTMSRRNVFRPQYEWERLGARSTKVAPIARAILEASHSCPSLLNLLLVNSSQERF